MGWIFLCAVITVAALAFALKKYIDVLIISCVMTRKGIDPDDGEIRDAAKFVIKRLLKLR